MRSEYVDPDTVGPEVKVKINDLSPKQTFLIRENDLEQSVIGAIYYYKKTKDTFEVYLYTDTDITVFETKDLQSNAYEEIKTTTHSFGSVANY